MVYDEFSVNYNLGYTDEFELEDIEGRRLWINDAVDEDIINSIVYHIMRYNRLDKGKKRRKPIILYINSPGGNVSDGYALISTIKNSITPVYTVNVGMAASMAFLIFISGDKKYCMPYAEFLMHSGSSFAMNSTDKCIDQIQFQANGIEPMTKQFVLENTTISDEYYDEKYRTEWYFLADEAKENGVCDFIVGQDCTMDEII